MNAADFSKLLEETINSGTTVITGRQKAVKILINRALASIKDPDGVTKGLTDNGEIDLDYFNSFPCVRRLALSLRKGVCGFEKRKLEHFSQFKEAENILVQIDLLDTLIQDISNLISFFNQKTTYFYKSGWITDEKAESILNDTLRTLERCYVDRAEIIDVRGQEVSKEDVDFLLFFWEKICTSYKNEKQVYESALNDLKNLKANLGV